MSDFNPDQFMSTEVTQSNETDYTLLPEGEYAGVISDAKADTTSNGSYLMRLTWLIDDANAREVMNSEEPKCSQTIWLDIDENTGHLDFGTNKNIMLGQLRDALGQNDGSPWSPSMLIGQPATVLVEHSADGKYSNVTKVAAQS